MKKINIVLNLKYSIVLFFLFVTTILKAQPPVANFTITNNMCLGDQANYGDASTGAPDTWVWYFQGGIPSSSTLQNPPNIDYFAPGIYEVKLVVSNINGADSISQFVNVFDLPTVSFNTLDVLCNGGTDGSAEAIVAGGTPPYFYTWSSGGFNSIENNLAAGNYTLNIQDVNNCMVSGNTDIYEPSLLVVNVYDTAFCEGGGTSLDPDVFGGTPPYIYLWDNAGASTDEILVEFPIDSTNYIVTVTDANGCTNSDNSFVSVIPTPTANEEYISLCEDTLGQAIFDLSLIESGVMGGESNAIYWYSDPGLTMFISEYTTYQSSTDTIYAYIESPDFCTNATEVYLVVKDSLTNAINGIVNFQGAPITNGEVRLIRKSGVLPSDMEVVQVKPVNSIGEFIFSDVPKGNYIVKAYGDTMLYDNISTYSGDVSDWASASEINVVSTCDDTVSVNIELIVMPSNSGLGSISGRLIQDDGQGTLAKAPGDPIGDIDITVEQSPGGAIMSATTTDIDGYFTFDGLEAGDYIIYADMLGYTTTPQVISFDGSNMNQNVTLCSNDTIAVVDVCNSVITSIASLYNDNKFNVYPNPASDILTLQFTNDMTVAINIIDIQGRVVISQNGIRNNSIIDTSDLVEGLYQLKIVGSNLYTIKKILIQR
jgi:Secretion system C-terminal sorting domain/SprB repeat/Carboxypeptidase regulatory-like domain